MELIARAVAGLEKNTSQELACDLRAGTCGAGQSVTGGEESYPRLEENDIAREQAALEEAIRRVERAR